MTRPPVSRFARTRLAFIALLGAPEAALAHAGHAPLSGLPDLLLHHSWTLGLLLVGGIGLWRAWSGRHAASRSRRR